MTGFWTDSIQNMANAWKAGFTSVDGYIFFSGKRDPVAQVKEVVTKLRAANATFGRLWYDIEGSESIRDGSTD